MTPLRILHLVISDRFAGVEQFVLRLATVQARAGHDVYVAGGATRMMRQPLSTAGARHTAVTGMPRAMRAVRSRRFDVVATHMTDADATASFALAADRDTALVSTRHFARPRRRFGPLGVDSLLGRIDAEVSISQAVADAIGSPSTVVHTGVPGAEQAPPARRVLMVQRLEREKRTDIGIRAFVESGIAEDGWRLDIIGDGGERTRLEHLVSKLTEASGTSHPIRFLGRRDDVPDLLGHGGMLLAPCPVEGLGIAVLEAMSHGIPVLSAGAAGHLDLLAGLDGRAFFRPDDVDDAAAALRMFARDAERRSQHGIAGRRRQRDDFSLAAQLSGTDAVYRAALARRRR